MPSENIIKLAKRLKEEFNLDVHPENFQRTYAGINMVRQGAFLWIFNEPITTVNTPSIIGGCEPMSKYIVKRNKLEIQKDRFGEIEVYAYSPKDVGYDRIK